MPTDSTGLGFIHRFDPATSSDPRTLLLLHGTGGDEEEIMGLGEAVAPGLARLAPRGQVSEAGANRFFRRLAEGVFDVDDLKRRADDLAEFVVRAAARYRLEARNIVAVGYSNGANIASAVLLIRPDVIGDAILLRPMVPFEPERRILLGGREVLAIGGALDPLVPPDHLARLEELFVERGARFTGKVTPASHGLTRADLEIARNWLRGRSLPPA